MASASSFQGSLPAASPGLRVKAPASFGRVLIHYSGSVPAAPITAQAVVQTPSPSGGRENECVASMLHPGDVLKEEVPVPWPSRWLRDDRFRQNAFIGLFPILVAKPSLWAWILGIAVTGLLWLGVLRIVRWRRRLAQLPPPRHGWERPARRRLPLLQPLMLRRPALYLFAAAVSAILASVVTVQPPQ